MARSSYSSPLLQGLRKRSSRRGRPEAALAATTELTKALEQMFATGQRERALQSRMRQQRGEEALRQAVLGEEELDIGEEAIRAGITQTPGGAPLAATPGAGDVFTEREQQAAGLEQRIVEAQSGLEGAEARNVEDTKRRLAERIGEIRTTAGQTTRAEELRSTPQGAMRIRPRSLERDYVKRAEEGLEAIGAPAALDVATAELQRRAAPDATYTVVAGDRIENIALKHEIPEWELKEANPQIANFDVIEVGDVINLPGIGAETVDDAPGAPAGELVKLAPALGEPGISPDEAADELERLVAQRKVINPMTILGQDPRYLPSIKFVEYAIQRAKDGDMSAISRLAGRVVSRREVRSGELDLDELSSKYRQFASGVKSDARDLYRSRVDERELKRTESIKGWEDTVFSMIMQHKGNKLNEEEARDFAEDLGLMFGENPQVAMGLFAHNMNMNAANQKAAATRRSAARASRSTAGGRYPWSPFPTLKALRAEIAKAQDEKHRWFSNEASSNLSLLDRVQKLAVLRKGDEGVDAVKKGEEDRKLAYDQHKKALFEFQQADLRVKALKEQEKLWEAIEGGYVPGADGKTGDGEKTKIDRAVEAFKGDTVFLGKLNGAKGAAEYAGLWATYEGALAKAVGAEVAAQMIKAMKAHYTRPENNLGKDAGGGAPLKEPTVTKSRDPESGLVTKISTSVYVPGAGSFDEASIKANPRALMDKAKKPGDLRKLAGWYKQRGYNDLSDEAEATATDMEDEARRKREKKARWEKRSAEGVRGVPMKRGSRTTGRRIYGTKESRGPSSGPVQH